MRIALVSANLFDIGGVENHIRFIGRELARAGHELRLFKPTWHEDVAAATARDDGIASEVIDLGPRPFEQRYLGVVARFAYVPGFLKRIAFSTAARRVRDVVRAWRPDLVWQHDLSSSWLACRLLARELPVVLTNHTGEYLLLARLPGADVLLRALLRHYTAVIGPSRELTPHVHPRAVTIHNGVDLALFTPLEPAVRTAQRRALLGERAGRFVVFCPRRWAPSKGVVFLARALARLVADGRRDVLVVFAGSDYDLYREYARDVRAALAGSEAAYLEVGNLDLPAMRDWYQVSDLVVIPSLMEAVSLAALEAMACGAPILSTEVGGMPEIITDGDTGLLVGAGDDAALARAIVRAASDPALLAGLAARGLAVVRARYGWDQIARATAQVLEEARRP